MKLQKTERNKFLITLMVSLIILFVFFILTLSLGSEKINLINALWGQTSKITEGTDPSPNFDRIILLNLRLPRALLAILAGGLLAGSGAVFQLFFRNELAEPGIIGISSGATLGAVSASVLGLGVNLASIKPFFSILKFISPINLFAFIGALLAGVIIIVLAFNKESSSKNSTVMILLCGTALGTLYSALSSLILITSSKELGSIYSWILGSFNGHGWKELLFILIPSIISIIIMFSIQNQLDLLACGEISAKSLGVSVNKLRILVLISAAFAVSAAICAGGTISFVGLIAPHIVRKLTGSKAKTLLPLSMIFGSLLLLLADTIAKTVISPSELPAGIITSILGVPFFLSLFLNTSRT